MVTTIANAELEARIRKRLDSLTKPPSSLGRLEDLVLQLGLIQATETPSVDGKAMLLFCADHGVVEERISPYPAEVTRQMVANFQAGGAAINVLCRQYEIEPVIVDMGVGHPTRNFAREPAMTRADAKRAISVGKTYAATRGNILGAGEMGIGNSTAAAALLCAFTDAHPEDAAGRGTGLDDEGLARKIAVLGRALELHQPDPADPLGVVAAVGGFEIAAIVGLILGAAQQRKMVVLDGFISCSAALVVRAMEPAALDYVVYSHRSAERGHARMLAALEARPLLDLDLRLGEGTGAAIGIGLLSAALRLYREMATFDSAGVSTSERLLTSPTV